VAVQYREAANPTVEKDTGGGQDTLRRHDNYSNDSMPCGRNRMVKENSRPKNARKRTRENKRPSRTQGTTLRKKKELQGRKKRIRIIG